MSRDWRRRGCASAKACCHGTVVTLVSQSSPISEQRGPPQGEVVQWGRCPAASGLCRGRSGWTHDGHSVHPSAFRQGHTQPRLGGCNSHCLHLQLFKDSSTVWGSSYFFNKFTLKTKSVMPAYPFLLLPPPIKICLFIYLAVPHAGCTLQHAGSGSWTRAPCIGSAES